MGKKVVHRLSRVYTAQPLLSVDSVELVISACEQSGRAVVPEVKAPLSLSKWLVVTDASQQLVLDSAAESGMSSVPIKGNAVSVLVGPEGGFTSKELDDVKAMGVTAVSLGPGVLRTETAGPAAIVVLQAGVGDL